MKNKRSTLIKLAVAVVIVLIAGIFVFNRFSIGEGTVPDLAQHQSLADIDEQQWSTSKSNSTPDVPGMTFVGENEFLSLFINKGTTEVAVVDKKTNKIWYTNPQDRDQDTLATAFEKDKLGSQFYFTFSDTKRRVRSFYNNQHSVLKEQFEIEELSNGIRIVYTVGDMDRGIEVLPQMLSADRFDALLTNSEILSESDIKYASRRWRLNKSTNIYERIDQGLSTRIELDRVIQIFDDIGYTAEDLNQDNLEHNLPAAHIDRPIFVIPLEYRLDGHNLVVTIPVDEISESDGMKIRELAFLPFFGVADNEQEGYIFVPDGSGSIIHLNNGKASSEHYAQRVYGRDQAKEVDTRSQVSETVRLPVFGMKQDDVGLFGIIEHGDAISVITADVSGRQNSYNSVFNRFTIRDYEEVEITGMDTVSKVAIDQPHMYKGNLTIRYAFLSGEDASYSGMAHHYQSYLLNKYDFTELTPQQDIPFYLDIVGAINKVQHFLGIPYKGIETLTTFDQSVEIVDALLEQDIKHINLKYQGWFNKGVKHKNVSNVKIEKKLGGKSAFNKLIQYLEEQDIAIYPDVAFLNIYQKSSGFITSRDTARFINTKPARETEIYLPTGKENYMFDPYYILSTARLPSFVDDFINRYTRLDIESISLRDLGSIVNSDHRARRSVNRQQSLVVIEQQLQEVYTHVPNIMLREANAYALPYVSHIVDVPLHCSGFIITDECVPFYQMVIHGLIPYSGEAINLNNEQDYRQNLLKHLEYGAYPQFSLGYASSSKVKNTEFDHLYALHYSGWVGFASEMYHELNTIMKEIQSEKMVEHKKLRHGVFETIYSNGMSVIVNYNSHPIEIDGMTIDGVYYSIRGLTNE